MGIITKEEAKESKELAHTNLSLAVSAFKTVPNGTKEDFLLLVEQVYGPTAEHKPKRRSKLTLARIILNVALALFTLMLFGYFGAIAIGRIQPPDRFTSPELVVVAIGWLMLWSVRFPKVLERLSLIKLPGGVEVTLKEIEKKQATQQSALDRVEAILANLLSQEEKYHLRTLARGGEDYKGCPSLREELFRLRRFGLITEVSPQRIGDIFDDRVVRIEKWIKLTHEGHAFLRAHDRIDRA